MHAPHHVFVSYRTMEPDLAVARALAAALEAGGHTAFIAADDVTWGETWPQRIDHELGRCDYFVLLLSPEASVSEMVTEEVRRVKQRRDLTGKPTVLPVRVRLPEDFPLNYDLGGYLGSVQYEIWKDPGDTGALAKALVDHVNRGVGTEQAGDVTPEPVNRDDHPPLPSAAPEYPSGQVGSDSPLYVDRASLEVDALRAILLPSALLRIKAPRQMGKTSLLSRIVEHATKNSCRAVPITFQLADAQVFLEIDRLIDWIATVIAWKLGIDRPVDILTAEIGSKLAITDFIENRLLPRSDTPLVLAFDEVDLLFEHRDVAADFFGLLRSWHETSKSASPSLQRLRLVIVHSTEVYIPLSTNQSPFNVGEQLEPLDFTEQQTLDLANRHGLNWSAVQVARLQGLVGGHPYLTRLALYHARYREVPLEKLESTAATERGIFGDHLRRLLWILEQHPNLAAAMRKVVNSPSPVRLPSEDAFKLESLGLLHFDDDEAALPRYSIYRNYFRKRLGATA